MTPRDAERFWEFDAEVTEESLVLCSACKEASPLREWTEGIVDCELCGDHLAIVCPRCDHHFDHIYAVKFHVIPMKEVNP